MMWAPGSNIPRVLIAGSGAVWLVASLVQFSKNHWFDSCLYVTAATLLWLFAAYGSPRRAAAYAAGVAGAWRVWNLVVVYQDGMADERVLSTIAAWSMFTVLTVALIALNWRIAAKLLEVRDD